MDFVFLFEPGKVKEVVGELTDFILEYAIALAAVSALAMALIEGFKSLAKTRERFHMRRLHEWIVSSPIPTIQIEGLTAETAAAHQFRELVFRQLMHLSTGIDLVDRSLATLQSIDGKHFYPSTANALFTLELEKMMGQIQDAADIALNTPEVHKELFLFLTSGARIDDVRTWVNASRLTAAKQSDEMKKNGVEAYGRLSKYVRRRLDGLQLAANYTWAKKNQWWSIVVGGILMAASLFYLESLKPGEATNVTGWIQIIVASLLGGIVAPIAKDLVSALKKVRQVG
ncbi:MAG TPA: hypothetical protein VFU13_23365 [Steroidobacteraceae bacterium]|nr:hypothetical protein [Steroidobacteraceae bacterium]